MNLDFVTITGIDDNTEIAFIDEMTDRFPHVEWGILLSEKRKGTPRYPSDRWLAELTSTLRGNHSGKYDSVFAAHLCGDLCNRFIQLEAETYLSGELIEHSQPGFFYRIQLNGYPENVYCHTQINRIASRMAGTADIILPIPNEAIRDRVRHTFLDNVAFLHDPSRGRGIEPDEWPQTDLPGFVGFAGGIGPDNIRRVLDTLCRRTDDRHYWIDMESGVRTDDRLDPSKVEKVLTIARDYT